MNPMIEAYERINALKRTRAMLLALCILFGLTIIMLAKAPVRQENALLKRYALRLEAQNAQKDKSFIKLVEQVQGRPVRLRK